jgi:hypothetical protein
VLIRTRKFSADDLSRFRDLQQRSFAILELAASTLQAGQSETRVARRLVRQYRDAGADGFFHLPVVLFGKRTALPGDWSLRDFFPRDDVLLRNGDSVILDAAPLFDGYLVDTSYSLCFGENPVHRKMMANLAEFRDDIRDGVNFGRRFKAIAESVAARMRDLGYDPVHTKHPGEVLGHRTLKSVKLPFTWRIRGFDGLSLGWFLLKGKAANAGISRHAPTWTSNATSNHAPHDGLWLVEPHAGSGAVGAKWEEILAIEDGKARWLDDDVPHVRQWAQIARGADYGPRAGGR